MDDSVKKRLNTIEIDKGGIDHGISYDRNAMNDKFDIYSRAVGVHSNISNMSEDYTLTRYNIDVYNQKMPKFIREQRKVLRIIKSFILVPKDKLRRYYNNEQKVDLVWKSLKYQMDIIEELLVGELDECVIMARTNEGQVINSFLDGLMDRSSTIVEKEVNEPTMGSKMRESR